jgi:hypothetical protein
MAGQAGRITENPTFGIYERSPLLGASLWVLSEEYILEPVPVPFVEKGSGIGSKSRSDRRLFP